jgi:Protein of unknown function (DUF2802)
MIDMNIDVMATLFLVLVVAVLHIPLWWKLRVLQKRTRQHEETLKILMNDMHDLCADTAHINEFKLNSEQQLRRLAERQDQVDSREPASAAYKHAIKLAQKGVSIDELMAACGLVRGEAELLIRMHRLN